MRYARKAKHALDVSLHQRREVAVAHGRYGKPGQQQRHVPLAGICHGAEPRQHGHGHNLGYGGNKGRGVVGCALIHVRRPEVEGKHRQLEEHAAKEHQQPNQRGGM